MSGMKRQLEVVQEVARRGGWFWVPYTSQIVSGAGSVTFVIEPLPSSWVSTLYRDGVVVATAADGPAGDSEDVDAILAWGRAVEGLCRRIHDEENSGVRSFDAMMDEIEVRVGGVTGSNYMGDRAVIVFLSDDELEGDHLVFSPDDDPDASTWVAAVYSGDDFVEDIGSRIPKSSRDIDRIVTWIRGIKAGYMA